MVQDLQSKKTTQGANPLLQALQIDDQIASEKETAEILAGLGQEKAVTLLFDALLKSVNNESRKRVVEELRRIGSQRATELLVSIMTDDFDPEVQHGALEALKQIGSKSAIDALLSALRGREPILRWEAARALGDFDSDIVVDALIDATKSPFRADPAIRSLIKIGSDRAVDRLIEIMQDVFCGSGTSSYDAMVGLLRLGTDKAIDALFKASTENPIQRTRLYMQLSQFKHSYLIPPLCQRLGNKTLSTDDRIAAAEMLGIIGTENEIPLLESIWKDWGEDSDREVSWRAHRAAEEVSFRELKRKAEREHALEETRAFIVHEFRHALSPLNAFVKMLDEALNQPELDKERLSNLTARIRKQTNTAFDVVNQYIDYSRPLAPKFDRIDINKLVRESLDEFKAKFEEQNITVRLLFAENVAAEVDKQLLLQVFRNVIDNALQAINRNGSLSISTLNGTGTVIVIIRDDGVGIESEHLPHIFDLGFTTLGGVQGAGVGLPLSKRLIEEAHNGSIAVHNNTDGPGVSVSLTLPIKQLERANGRQPLTPIDS